MMCIDRARLHINQYTAEYWGLCRGTGSGPTAFACTEAEALHQLVQNKLLKEELAYERFSKLGGLPTTSQLSESS